MSRALFNLCGVAALLLWSGGVAASPKVVGFDLVKERGVYPRGIRSQQRRNVVQSALENDRVSVQYLVNVSVGTPPQPLQLQIDTGSSDIWFPSANGDVCEKSFDCGGGTFDPNSSSTFIDIGPNQFNISYADGTQLLGDYVVDVFSIGNAGVQNMTMALATSANQAIGTSGIMGIGYASDEAKPESSTNATYPNLVDVLKAQGFINTAGYSLWLNDLNDDTGSILFGGIDTAKFSGPLISLPVQVDNTTGILDSFYVVMTSFSISDSSGRDTFTDQDTAVLALLDSGTSYLQLPLELASVVYNQIPFVNDTTYGFVVPCNLADVDANLTFGFGGSGGAQIIVSLREFVLPLSKPDGSGTPALDENGDPVTFKNGQKVCNLGIATSPDATVTLGDTFLRSAYVVYDLETNEIAIAQTVFNSESSNIVEFNNDGSIPDVTQTALETTVTPLFGTYPPTLRFPRYL